MSGLEEALALAREVFWLHALVFLRVGPVMALFPGFGEQSVPVRIKLVLAVAFTVVVAPAVAPRLATDLLDMSDYGRLALVETGIGFAIGVGIRLFLMALQTCGSIAAQATSLSQILGSASVTPLPAIGHILVVGALALAMILGLHVRVTEMLVLTYDVLPVGRRPDTGALSEWGMRQVADAFSLAFMLSAPFVLVSVLYNLTLGIINRAMPQMLVVFVGAPVITGAGLFLLFLLAPTMLTVWARALIGFIDNPFGGL